MVKAPVNPKKAIKPPLQPIHPAANKPEDPPRTEFRFFTEFDFIIEIRLVDAAPRRKQ